MGEQAVKQVLKAEGTGFLLSGGFLRVRGVRREGRKKIGLKDS